MQTFNSKVAQKNTCRKCKTSFLSNDGSPCPECSKKNKELAVKREENKQAKASEAKAAEDEEKSDI